MTCQEKGKVSQETLDFGNERQVKRKEIVHLERRPVKEGLTRKIKDLTKSLIT